MPNGFGRGFRFRGCSLPLPFVGWGRGGLPRCWACWGAPLPYYPMSREQELSVLKDQAQMLRQSIEEIERRVKDLEAKG